MNVFINTHFSCLFAPHRGHFEDMCAQYLMRVDMPLKVVLEQSSMSLKFGFIYKGILFYDSMKEESTQSCVCFVRAEPG